VARGGRNPRVYIEGDADGVRKASRDAESALGRLNTAGTRAFGGMRTAALAAGVAFAGITVGVAKFGVSAVKAAIDAEASSAKVKRMVENAGLSWDKYGAKIDKAIQAQSRRFKMDDEDLAESFGNMLRTTGDVNKALALNATAADVARAKGIDLAAAQSTLARVYNGSFGGLRKLGIAFEPVTKAQDKLKQSGRDYTQQQMEQAKAADKVASREAALAAVRQKFAGQADAYAKTTQGKIEGFQVAWENLQETIGTRILPAVGDAFDAMSDGIKTVTDEWPRIERAIAPVIDAFGSKLTAAVAGFSKAARQAFPVVAEIIGQVRAPIVATVANLSRLWGALAEDGARAFRQLAPVVGPLMREILRTVQSVVALITAIWVRWGDEITTVVVGALRAVATVMRPALQVVRGIIVAVTAAINGDWSKAWQGVVTALRGALSLVLALLRTMPARMAGAALAIGSALISGIGSGLRQLPSILAAIIGAAIRALPGLLAGAAADAGRALGSMFANGLKAAAGSISGALNPFSSGGYIGGPGPAHVDSQLVIARPDEVILTPEQQRLVESGVSIDHALAMTGGKVGGRRFASGGRIRRRLGASEPVPDLSDVDVTPYPGGGFLTSDGLFIPDSGAAGRAARAAARRTRTDRSSAARTGRTLLGFRPRTAPSASDAITARHRDDSLQDKRAEAAAEQTARGAGITNPEKLDAIRQQAVRAVRIRELRADRGDLVAERGRITRKLTGLARARKAAYAALRKAHTPGRRREVLDRITDLNRQMQDAWDERAGVDREIADVDAQLAELGYDQATTAAQITDLPDVAPSSSSSGGDTASGGGSLTDADRQAINRGIAADAFIQAAFGPGDIGTGGQTAIGAATGGRWVPIRVDAQSFAAATASAAGSIGYVTASLVPSGA
jgi:hypothetical protein